MNDNGKKCRKALSALSPRMDGEGTVCNIRSIAKNGENRKIRSLNVSQTYASSPVFSQYNSSNLVDLVRFRARVQPDDDAFIYLEDGVSEEIHLTNSALDRRSRAIGAWLQKHNKTGERILLLFPPGLEFITAFFGCLYAGATAVPVYPPRRNRSMLRIQAVADSSNAALALTTSDVYKRVTELIEETPDLKNIPWLSTDQLPAGIEDEWVEPNLDLSSLAFLQFTSGSTGTPKGVMLSHGNMLHNSLLIQTGFEHTRSSKGVFWLPSYHDMGLIGGIIQPLYCGRTNVLMSPLSFLLKPYRWLAAITKYGGTTSGGPNFAYDMCVQKIRDDQLDSLDLSSWQVAFNGAEPVQPETLENFTKKFERCGFRYEAFYPCFGLAEGTLIVTGGTQSAPPKTKTVDADALAADKIVDAIPGTDHIKRLVSSGSVILDQKLRIVDPVTRRVCGENAVGEIWTSSPSVAQGYWKNPAATEETFHAYTSDTNEGPFMRTGDLGFLSEGELYVTGRIKDLIILRGVNLYPQDIEMTAQKVHPLLRLNAGGAFMLGDDRDEKLVLVQEVERRFRPGDETEIFPEIRKAIALEHEVPIDTIVLVRAGTVPKTSSGKIQRHACRDGFQNGTLSELARWSLAAAGSAETPSKPARKTLGSYADEENPLHYDPNASKLSADETQGEPRSTESDAGEMAKLFAVKKALEKQPVEPEKPALISLRAIDYNETAKIVLEEVHRIAKERAKGLTLDTDINELGLDSLERMEILASLEDKFGGQFPESVLPTLSTGREVVDATRKYLGGGSRLEAEERVFKVSEASCDFAQFPEYKIFKQKMDLLASTKMSHFFDVHEGITDSTTVIDGKTYSNFAAYNYISAAGHPAVTEAAVEAARKYGTSTSASRIVSGTKPIHVELEREIARFLGTDDAITFTAGHQTNETTIGHLMGADDLILHDALAHNSLVQGCILSGARRRPFPHNDWEAIDWILQKHRDRYRRVLIVCEGVYSMDGDYPDLPKFIEIKKKHHAMMMIDEAHSLGVLGKTGRGIAEFFDVDRRDVEVWMCTLSKTLGACGGYISGRREMIQYLKFTTPAFMFSAAMSPPVAAAALEALHLLEREPERCERLRDNSRFFKKCAQNLGMDTGLATETGVVPIIIGDSIKCLAISKMLFDRGINANPILHPAVEEKASRIRFFLTCSHTHEQLRYAAETLAAVIKELDNRS